MELRQLHHFLTVADHLNFTRAAQELHLVQSAVSTSVQALEHELGAALFERTTRRVTLTAAGEALLPRARRVLAEATAAREDVDAVRGLVSGALAIGTIQTLTWVDLPTVVASFHRSHPGVQVTLREAPVDDLVALLRAAELDLAFLALDEGGLPKDLTPLASHEEELALITGPDHRLVDRRRVAPRELAQERFIDFQCGTGLQTVVVRLCDRAGLDRQVAFQVTQLDLLVELVGRGLGVAIVPRPVAQRSGLPTIALRHHDVRRRVALVARSAEPTNPAVRALLPELLSRPT